MFKFLNTHSVWSKYTVKLKKNISQKFYDKYREQGCSLDNVRHLIAVEGDKEEWGTPDWMLELANEFPSSMHLLDSISIEFGRSELDIYCKGQYSFHNFAKLLDVLSPYIKEGFLGYSILTQHCVILVYLAEGKLHFINPENLNLDHKFSITMESNKND